MKIGLVCPYNIFRGGGVQECVLALQAELTARGHQARIITPRPRDTDKDSDERMLLVGTATDLKSPFHTTAQVSVSVDMAALDVLLTHENFDVLHFHEPWVPILSRQILGHSTSANVATFHAKLPGTIVSRTIELVITPYTKSVLRNLHSLSAVSPSAAEYVYSLTDRDVTIIPNGIDLAKYQPLAKNKPNHKTKTIVYIGRLEQRKGLKYLLKAYGPLARMHDDVRLVIVGEGPDRAKLETLVRDQDLPRVTFTGFVDEATKLQLLHQADLFCSPALYGESFGIVLLEAMAAGCVTVAGDNPGYRSVLQQTGSVSLVDPKATDQFVQRLELLLYDLAIRKAWLAWAAKYVRQFDYGKVVDQYLELYQKALEHKRHA